MSGENEEKAKLGMRMLERTQSTALFDYSAVSSSSFLVSVVAKLVILDVGS